MLLTLLMLVPMAEPDARTLAAVKALKGTAEVDRGLLAEANLSVKIEGTTDAALAKLCKHPQIGALQISEASRLTEKGFADLRELPKLQKLLIYKSSFGDKALAEIGHMKALEVLYLGESKITDAGLVGLKGLSDLKVLDLYDCKIGDRGLPALAALEKLEDLNLSGTKVTDAGIVALKDCKSLKTLKLTRTAVTRKGTEELESHLTKLVIRQ
jgi:Leucine-rich repeat (LRR) protein